MDDYFYVSILVPVSVFVPLTVGFSKYKMLDIKARIVTWYLVFDGVSNLIYYLLALYHKNNMVVSHFFTVLELFILSMYYVKSSESTQLTRFIRFVIFAFIVAAIMNILFFQDIQSYNSYTRSVETLILIILSINNFIKLLDNSDKASKYRVSEVYFTSAILLYFSGAFLIFTIFNLFDIAIGLEMLLWNTHATFLLFMYLLFAVGLWKYNR